MTTIMVMNCITTIMTMIVASFVAIATAPPIIDERGPLAFGDDFSAASACGAPYAPLGARLRSPGVDPLTPGRRSQAQESMLTFRISTQTPAHRQARIISVLVSLAR
jgi:hypothetical protein